MPYLVTGVGQLDFMKDFRDELGAAPDDKTMLILGGGLGFRLSDRFELDVSARDHILSAKDLEDTSKPDDLLGNWMFGASVRFSLGGSSPQGQKPLFGKAEPPSKPLPPLREMEAEEMEAEEMEAEAPEEKQVEKVILRTPAKGSAVGYAGERMIMFPVPTEGEIYIRYGTPGGVNIESRSVTGETAPAAPAVPQAGSAPSSMTIPAPPAPAAAAPAPDLEMIRRIIRDELHRAGVVRESGEAAPEGRWVEEGRRDPLLRRASSSRSRRRIPPANTKWTTLKTTVTTGTIGFRAYTGLGLDDPTEFVLGARMNLGPITADSPFLFVPEVALGFGSDLTTYLVAGNLQLPLGNLGGSQQWSPYVSTGLGFLKVDSGGESDTDLTVNFAAGVDARFGKWAPFLEYQGVRGFDVNRLLVGVRFRQ